MIHMSLTERNKSFIKYLVFASIFIGMICSRNGSVFRAIATVFTTYVVTGGWRFLRIFYHTAYRDLRALIAFQKVQFFIRVQKSRNGTVPKIFKEIVRKYPNRDALCSEDMSWTFTELDKFSNRVANYFLELGYNSGEEIALLMDSRPEFVGIWLGLAKAGLVTALINTNQRLDTLIHSITVVNCKAVIFSSELSQAVKDIVPMLNDKYPMKYFCFGTCDTDEIPFRPLKELINESSTDDPRTINSGNFTDRLFYIYTSGTTGMPKAAIIKQSRYIYLGTSLRFLFNFRDDDVFYTCIPLYHLAGGVLGTCQCLIHGNTMAVRAKFSASKFWDDCITYKCTVAQYIGEICRYLLAQPKKTIDQQHKVRMMFGNGLRPKIWKEFIERFNIEQIGELYGSTEGNANIVNVDNQEGACGFISQIAPFIYPVTLIKVNEETGEPVRDKNGLCIRVKPYETGEFVGKIIDSDPSRSFDGYATKEANKKKIISNVFKKGDKAFVSGDLLTMDEFGYLYFKDRTGDTFRWKGENVSTMEVESVISNIVKLADCIVFGVDVPGCEGKAGMAVIPDTEKSINLKDVLQRLQKVLPVFSIPLFIRLVENIEITGTFKLPKITLQKQGYDPNVIKDPIFFLDMKKAEYVPLNCDTFNQIQSGNIRL